MEENVEAVRPLAEHIIRAPADEHAGAFFRKLHNRFELREKNLVAHGQGAGGVPLGGVISHRQMEEKAACRLLFRFLKGFLREAALLRRELDERFIVIRDAQLLRQLLSDPASAGAVLPRNGDDTVFQF